MTTRHYVYDCNMVHLVPLPNSILIHLARNIMYKIVFLVNVLCSFIRNPAQWDSLCGTSEIRFGGMLSNRVSIAKMRY